MSFSIELFINLSKHNKIGNIKSKPWEIDQSLKGISKDY
jgi:hypothetical protein